MTDWSKYHSRRRKLKYVAIVCAIIGFYLLYGIAAELTSDNENATEQKIVVPEQDDLESPPNVEPEPEIKSMPRNENTADSKEKETELEIHRLVNIERQKHGLKTLSYDDALASIARNHSEDMAQRKFYSHVNPDGDDPTARGHKTGYNCRVVQGDGYWEGIGENLHMVSGSTITFWDSPESIAKDAVEGWMNSVGHRENILTEHYLSEGIGVEITTFEIYVTQNFC
ncbi:MAG: CAP domain-containing protein [Nitrosopumilaceae archaeon]